MLKKLNLLLLDLNNDQRGIYPDFVKDILKCTWKIIYFSNFLWLYIIFIFINLFTLCFIIMFKEGISFIRKKNVCN